MTTRKTRSDFRRLITYEAYNAWVRGAHFKKDNTYVSPVSIKLFGNRIIFRLQPSYHPEQPIYFTMCGWNTNTTRERLLIAGVQVRKDQGSGIALNVNMKGISNPTNLLLGDNTLYQYVEGTNIIRITTMNERTDVLDKICSLEGLYS